eukprot:2686191-Ditylum_brightwellii.AAC.1
MLVVPSGGRKVIESGVGATAPAVPSSRGPAGTLVAMWGPSQAYGGNESTRKVFCWNSTWPRWVRRPWFDANHGGAMLFSCLIL